MLYTMKPWPHQQAAYDFAVEREAAMLAMFMGTGKSKVAVDIVVNRGHQATLILCPRSVMNVWPREFSKHAASPVATVVLDKGSLAEKTEKAKRAVESGKPVAVILNYDSAWREPFASWALKRKPAWDCVIADESHRGKSPQSKISKFLDKLRWNARQRLCLTGTPMPHSPLDIHPQYRFLDPAIFGRSFTQFRARYAVVNQMFPSQVRQWINQEELSEKVASIAFQVGKEVLTLPPVMHEVRNVELSPRARKAYRELERDLITTIEDETVTVPNALVKLLRLHQITSGHLPLPDRTTEHIDDGKEQALTDLLEDLPTEEPVIVFCLFRHDLKAVERVAQRLGRRHGELSGERNDLSPTATMREDVDVMGVQTASGGVGVDLTRAAYGVLFSIGYSLGDYQQLLARMDRPGQERPVHFYHLVASPSVDETIYEALNQKKEVVEAVLSRYRNQLAPV